MCIIQDVAKEIIFASIQCCFIITKEDVAAGIRCEKHLKHYEVILYYITFKCRTYSPHIVSDTVCLYVFSFLTPYFFLCIFLFHLLFSKH